jgi:hypothetical protein
LATVAAVVSSAVVSSAKGERMMWRKSSAATDALAISPAHGRKKMLTSGARMSLRGERKYNEMYVFAYDCSWARVIFICIPWRTREVKNCNDKFQNT